MTLAEYINNLEELHYVVNATELENGCTEIAFTNVEQDFSFEVETSKDIWDYYEGFDVEEEVLMWLEAKKNGVGGIPNVVQLVEEEKTIEDTLHELALKTINYKEEK